MASRLGINEEKIKQILPEFVGPERRFQKLGRLNGAPVFDDFAHHPSALAALAQGVRARYPHRRVIIVFQPHTYSRTGKLLNEFARSLAMFDQVLLLNIYASAREKSGYVTIKDLLEATRRLKPTVEYRSNLKEAAQYLTSVVGRGDLVLLVGAGDVYKIFQEFSGTKGTA